MTNQLSQNDFSRLHDRLFDVFGVSLTHPQIEKLLQLTPHWDGNTDTQGLDEMMDSICVHFVKLRVPTYGEADTLKFKTAIEASKPSFLDFIN